MSQKLQKKDFFKKIVIISKIIKIKNPKGDIDKITNKKSPLLKKFGEIYFSSIKKNKIKAWKKHKKYYSLIFLVNGEVEFAFFYKKKFYNIKLQKKKNIIMRIPPKIYFGFRGIKKNNTVCNILSDIHKDNETKTKRLIEIDYKKWKVKKKT